jgi:hypothetical protein
MGNIWDQIPSGGPAPEPSRRRPKTRQPLAGERLELCVLEAKVGWYLTHFQLGRTKPCLGEMCACQQADKTVPTRWQGYVLATELPRSGVVLAVLTRNCYDTCPELRDTSKSLLGAHLILTRKGGAQGIVLAHVQYDAHPLRLLPKLPYTHRDQLLRVWFSGMDSYLDVNKFFTDVSPSDTPLYGEEEKPADTERKDGAA